jgi:hypothetical protein
MFGMRGSFRPAVALAFAWAAGAACSSPDSGEPSNPEPPLMSVIITPGSATLVPGTSIRFTAKATGYSGDTTMAWRSTNPNVATVSQGNVVAVAEGTTDIVASVAERSSIAGAVRVTVAR